MHIEQFARQLCLFGREVEVAVAVMNALADPGWEGSAEALSEILRARGQAHDRRADRMAAALEERSRPMLMSEGEGHA